MPPNPDNIEDRFILSGDYQGRPARIEFYTNGAMAITRGQRGDSGFSEVWLDNLEKQALFEVMKGHYDVDETKEVTLRVTNDA